MTVEFRKTGLSGVLLVETRQFRDERGFFMEVFSERNWGARGFRHTFVQDNLSLSARGVLRGMHYQIEPEPQGKLVRVVNGAAFDVAVDIRAGSPTRGKWAGYTLTRDNGLAMWVPPGFAHGFLALEEDTALYYKATGFYAPACERAFLWSDPEVAIDWPIEPTEVSPKDAAAPPFAEAETNFIFAPDSAAGQKGDTP